MDPNNPPDEEVPAGWHRWYSERRKKYYYHNDATGEVQWTLPKGDGSKVIPKAVPAAPIVPTPARQLTPTNESSSETLAAGPGVSAVRSLANHPDVQKGLSDTGGESQELVLTSPTIKSPSAGNTSSAGSSETVGLLQSLFPYYSYDENTASLVQLTMPSLLPGEIDGRDDLGNTLLLLAIQYKAHDCMEQLIRIGADVNARNYAGSCSLHYACHFETFSEETVRMLISNGANPTYAEEAAQGGLTPLHYIAETGHIEVCRFLVSKGADPHKRDAYGRTPADCARDAGQEECAAAFASLTAVGGPGGWGFGEESSEIKELLLNIQADLQRALTAKETQRQEYETLIREKDINLTRKSDRILTLESERKQAEIKLDHGRSDVTALERRIAELVSQASSSSAALEEEKRGRVAAIGRADRRCLDLEAQVVAEIKKTEHESELREAAYAELSRERESGAVAMKEHLRVVRESSTHQVSIMQLNERIQSMERELARGRERIADLEKKGETSKAKFENMRSEMVEAKSKAVLEVSRAEEASASLEAVKADLEVERSRAQALSETMEDLRSDSNSMRSDLASVLTQLKSPQTSDVGTWKAKVEVLQTEVERLRAAESASLFSDSSRIALELAALKTQNERLQKSHEEDKKSLQAFESDNASAVRAELAASEAECKELRSKMLQKSSMMKIETDAVSQTKVSLLEKKVSDLSAELAMHRSRAVVLEAAAEEASSVKQESDMAAENMVAAEAVQRAIDDTRAAVTAEMTARLAAAEQASLLELKEVERRASTELEVAARNATAAEASRAKQVSQLESRIGGLEVRLIETEEDAASKAATVAQTHHAEIQAVKEASERELSSCKRELGNQIAALEESCRSLELMRSEAVAAAATITAQAEADNRRFTLEIREHCSAREEAERRLKEAMGLIEEAKVVDRRNAILDSRMVIEIERRRNLHEFVEDLKGKIRVYVRVRPLSDSEKGRGCHESYTRNHDSSVTYFQPDAKPPDDKKSYEFDKVYAGGVEDGNGQEVMFNDLRGLVLSCVEGKNVCIFAYGQTGSGKTFSMVGPDGSIGGNIQYEGSKAIPTASAGVTPRAIVELFEVLEERDALNVGEVDTSMYELYCDTLVDLLAPKQAKNEQKPSLNIKLAQHTSTGLVEVDGGTVLRTSTMDELISVMERGVSNRSTSSTMMNSESSRSHLVMVMVVRSTNRRSGATVFGKLTLVDLAGSERVDKSGAQGQQLKEAASINKSLSAIGDVVSALTLNHQHIPYRSHALTTLMSDSIGGSAKTVMVVCCSPADYNTKESLSALNFAQRCKNVRTHLGSNPAQAAAQVSALKQELARLKKSNAVKGKAPELDRGGGRTSTTKQMNTQRAYR
eukprot:CAMPEP_0114409984 /NCGR_PEP_ID=MMETSP0102-20121206/23754_1 /TAXON_ID=38822 ORGANISM="Pteridomonas danica, Strain PT" /NCGR_SAMPLE_ID=MMETSP0102 /ASSEMBLY_ACC=CAM_ASM_000212 /LENGTH=1368 /DNA_ID=CAMNT_0001577529 /DNA_START=40 /DNA_END=4147 /DNA_ORIENTATION=+